MKKRVLSLLLSCCCLCGTLAPALAADIPEVADPDKVVPYSEEEDPLTAQKRGDSVEFTPPELYANNSSGKVAQYSFMTDKTYQVPKGYNVFHGIDVSKWEGDINWNAVKKAGVDYAFIRVGYRGYGSSGNLAEDPNYEEYIDGALSAGIPIGVYIYSQAISSNEAIAEANFVLNRIKGYNITLPVVMDYEFYGNEGRLYDAHLTKAEATANCRAFCETVSNAGYTPMVYANKSFLTDNLNAGEISQIAPIWLAHYTNSTSYSGEYDYWQYSEEGRVDGINTNVDCNFFLTKGDLDSNGNSVKGFNDVLSSSWYADAVAFAVDHGLMSGTSKTKFSPNTASTRTMIAQVLYNLSGNPAVSYSKVYSDVADGKWYTDAVIWANKTGVMSGYNDGTFGISDPITREQIATVLYNYSKKFGVSVSKTQDLDQFADKNSISRYAVTPMKWAVANGIISGRSSTSLAPKGTASRAEYAAMLKNYLTGVGASLLP